LSLIKPIKRRKHTKPVRSKKEPIKADMCVMCGEYVPEGFMVCKRCREAVDKRE
jgi:hypothetical protein